VTLLTIFCVASLNPHLAHFDHKIGEGETLSWGTSTSPFAHGAMSPKTGSFYNNKRKTNIRLNLGRIFACVYTKGEGSALHFKVHCFSSCLYWAVVAYGSIFLIVLVDLQRVVLVK
jgi:hypothetical protein